MKGKSVMKFTSKKLLDVNLPRKLKLRDSYAFAALLFNFAGIFGKNQLGNKIQKDRVKEENKEK